MNTRPVDILLVEDNEDDVVMLREALHEARLINILNVACDGEKAMAYLRRQGEYKDALLPGLVILDINMPLKNGFQVLEEIKADPVLRHIPVVMLTTSDQEADVVTSYARGACSFIGKPIGFDKLKEVVKGFELYWALVARTPSTRGG